MNRNRELIPREPRRLKQPTKDVLREQLALAADEIIRLREVSETHVLRVEFEPQRAPWWRRIFRKPT